MPKNQSIIPIEIIANRIFILRGKKVIIDRDLAQFYGVLTKVFNQAIKRNITRFPEDFMFQLTKEEKKQVVTICDHLKTLKFSPVLPYAFTEQGVAMLSSVLNSERAIQINIAIIRTFTKLREMLTNYIELKKKIELIEEKYDQQFMILFRRLAEEETTF